jgi:hypothetical protein
MDPSSECLERPDESFTNALEASGKLNNIRGDMARKSKVMVQTYYNVSQLSQEDRAKKIQWLLEKDRFTCPNEHRMACFARPNE